MLADVMCTVNYPVPDVQCEVLSKRRQEETQQDANIFFDNMALFFFFFFGDVDQHGD